MARFFKTPLTCAFVLFFSLSPGQAESAGKTKSKSTASKKTKARPPAKGKDPLREAVKILRSGKYKDAAGRLHAYLKTNKSRPDEARYHLGKALYRLGNYHSALSQFALVLGRGSESPFYSAALEWCLFLSRKMGDQISVNQVVAENLPSSFPKEYRDEFLFRLARYHFTKGLAIEFGEVEGQVGETKVRETITGGKSFSGDIFGAEEGEEPKARTSEKGVSFDDDIFGFEDDPSRKVKKKRKAKKRRARKKGKKGRRKKRKLAKSRKKKSEPMALMIEKSDIQKTKLTAKEHFASAEKLILQVNTETPFGARAKFVEGLVLFHKGQENDALAAFKEVIRLTRKGKQVEDVALREAAFFQLARTHFGAKQPSFSIFYYNKVDRDSLAWLDSIYESSWAEYRLGNYEKALGNLLTLHAPFFTDEYYPESLILKAVSYYENCRYPEAKQILDSFLKRYEPVQKELQTLTSQDRAPEAYYEVLETFRARAKEGGDDKSTILSQLVALALSDEEVRRLDTAYREVASEYQRVEATAEFAPSGLLNSLRDELLKKRQDLKVSAGRALQRKLIREELHIKELVEQAVRIQIETSRGEQERFESKLRQVETRPKDVEGRFVEWTDDERLVWPFDGEYWRDELGTYELTLAHSCQ